VLAPGLAAAAGFLTGGVCAPDMVGKSKVVITKANIVTMRILRIQAPLNP
jgi:hypothetical protein